MKKLQCSLMVCCILMTGSLLWCWRSIGSPVLSATKAARCDCNPRILNANSTKGVEEEDKDSRWKEFMAEQLKDVEHGIQKHQPQETRNTILQDDPNARTVGRNIKPCLPNLEQKLNESLEMKDKMNLMEPNMTLYRQGSSQILILTPVKESYGSHSDSYMKLIKSIDYPHNLIAVVLGVDPSSEQTFQKYKKLENQATGFAKFSVIRLKAKSAYLGENWGDIHKEEAQYARRRGLAIARNELLYRSINDNFSYVLWVDVDVGSWPSDIIQHLISAKQDVIVPACMWRDDFGKLNVYDRNSWQETSNSLAYQVGLPNEFLVLEGYESNSRRKLITDLLSNKRMADLDGVGGCVLLVKASCHLHGLNFPSFVFEHHIETEGLAKMAQHMGYSVCGLPYLQVIHI